MSPSTVLMALSQMMRRPTLAFASGSLAFTTADASLVADAVGNLSGGGSRASAGPRTPGSEHGVLYPLDTLSQQTRAPQPAMPRQFHPCQIKSITSHARSRHRG